MQPRGLSDDALVTQITTACRDERRLVADIVRYLVEVEDRRLDLRQAHSSLFGFCVNALGMSEGAAFRRINASRLVRRFPCLLDKLASGDLHLGGLVLLRDYFTHENVEELALAASGKSESKLRKLIAKRWPQSAVPERIDKLRRWRIEPLSPDEYLVQFTMSASTHDKLQRARDLLRHSVPDGHIASIVDRALDLLIAKAERERMGTAKRPRPASDTSTETTSSSTRREVYARDGEQCTYRSETGERCPERGFLELDHAQALAFGGSSDPSNVRVLCRPHNRFRAEEDFGKEHVAAQIERRRQQSKDAVAPATEPPPGVDGFENDFRQRTSIEIEAPAPPGPDAPADEERAIYGLVDLGFARPASEQAVRSILARSGKRGPLGDVLREAIRVLSASP